MRIRQRLFILLEYLRRVLSLQLQPIEFDPEVGQQIQVGIASAFQPADLLAYFFHTRMPFIDFIKKPLDG